MSEPRDPYEVLQVEPTADDTVVRAAFRALAQRYHPDVAGSAGEIPMRELNAAWEIVRDPERRAAFDRSRAGSGTPGSSGPTPSAGPAPRSGPETTAFGHPVPPPSAPPWTGAAGPPPGRPSGSVLDFGVFYGWSLGEIARRDPGYLEWLDDKPEGRAYGAEIDTLLRRMGMRGARAADVPTARLRGRRIFGR